MQRTDEVEAILTLIRVMAATPYQSWAGSAEFGLRDFFEHARVRPELPREAVDTINSALLDLGLSKYSVESILVDPGASESVSSYSIKLLPADPNVSIITARL